MNRPAVAPELPPADVFRLVADLIDVYDHCIALYGGHHRVTRDVALVLADAKRQLTTLEV